MGECQIYILNFRSVAKTVLRLMIHESLILGKIFSIEWKLRQMWKNLTAINSKNIGHLISSHDNKSSKGLKHENKELAEQQSNGSNEEHLMESNINKTYFRSLNYSVIVSQVGSTVQIPCRIHLIGDEMVNPFNCLITSSLPSFSSSSSYFIFLWI